MSRADIRRDLSELDARSDIPAFELCLIRAVFLAVWRSTEKRIQAAAGAKIASMNGEASGETPLEIARRWMDMADLTASGVQLQLLQHARAALQGDRSAECDLWLDGPAVMSEAGWGLLRAVWELLPEDRSQLR
jgi:hypothetical protein